MSHFAQLDDNNIVINVIVAEQDFIDSGAVGDPSKWVQTSYNTKGGVHYDPNTNLPDGGVPLRKNYACIGFTYDSQRNAFIPPKPERTPSWVLNEQTCWWEAPVPLPEDSITVERKLNNVPSKHYRWDEPTISWVEVPEPEVQNVYNWLG
jgi:hypothetical protein